MMMQLEYERALLVINNIMGVANEDKDQLFRKLESDRQNWHTAQSTQEGIIRMWARLELQRLGYKEIKPKEKFSGNGNKEFKVLSLNEDIPKIPQTPKKSKRQY